mgnify:CR=1 FL=1|jgi:hypothetical protein
MAILFDEILTKGVRAGQIPARETKARSWYRDTARTYTRVNERKLMRGDTDRLTARPLVGQMYLFNYDAKHKATLPYFDRFPLVFPYKKVKGGFMGINLHYLPLTLRAQLMDSLYEVSSNTRYDESTRLRINYDILSNASKFRYFKPCVKHYLTSQLRSRFLYIYPSEWDIALFLPLERFEGASKSTVFADSRRAV